MLIVNAQAYRNHAFVRERIRIRDGMILEAGPDLAEEPGEEILDCGGDYIIPGFVDVHIHAFRGYDVMRGENDIRAMAVELRKEGVAAFCPTTMTATLEETAFAMAGVRAVRLSPGPGEAGVIAAHMEGPFLSEKHAGAQRKDCFLNPDWALFLEMTDGHPEDARLITLAPEKPGAREFILKAVKAGVAVSVGHTDATAEQTHDAADLGANHVTHTFNAQTPLHHRRPGVPGAALTDSRLYAEMICDGVHLHRDTVRLLWQAKGAEKAVAVTDAMEAAGMPDGEYALGGQKVYVNRSEARLADGTLAGSVLTMRRALENLIHLFHIPPEDAVRMCTETPAESVGEKTAGRIGPGSPAPVTRWTGDWQFVQTIG